MLGRRHRADYEIGTPLPRPGLARPRPDLSMGWNWIGNRFPHALSVLLEQPFKDVSWAKDAGDGLVAAAGDTVRRVVSGRVLGTLDNLS